MGGKGRTTTMGARLRELRHAAGLTQMQLAVDAGLSMSLVTALEYGLRHDPKLSTLLALTRALGCTLDDLVGGLEPPPLPPRKGKKQ
jgi:transcriptional regulator with XRE-family HTH domain